MDPTFKLAPFRQLTAGPSRQCESLRVPPWPKLGSFRQMSSRRPQIHPLPATSSQPGCQEPEAVLQFPAMDPTPELASFPHFYRPPDSARPIRVYACPFVAQDWLRSLIFPEISPPPRRPFSPAILATCNHHAETHLPAQQPPPREDSRLSLPYGDEERPRRPGPPPRSRPQKIDRQFREVASIAGFPKRVRLLRSQDFRRIYDGGVKYACPLFAAFCMREPQADSLPGEIRGPHIGFTTPRALGKAVLRNRVRRRVREAVRHQLERLSPQWSIVLNPRRKALDAPMPELLREIEKLFLRCNGS
jgi:ribonuclease P protein component